MRSFGAFSIHLSPFFFSSYISGGSFSVRIYHPHSFNFGAFGDIMAKGNIVGTWVGHSLLFNLNTSGRTILQNEVNGVWVANFWLHFNANPSKANSIHISSDWISIDGDSYGTRNVIEAFNSPIFHRDVGEEHPNWNSNSILFKELEAMFPFIQNVGVPHEVPRAIFHHLISVSGAVIFEEKVSIIMSKHFSLHSTLLVLSHWLPRKSIQFCFVLGMWTKVWLPRKLWIYLVVYQGLGLIVLKVICSLLA